MQASSALPCPICGSSHYCTLNPADGIVKCTQVGDGSFSQKKDRAGVGFFHRHNFDGVTPPPQQQQNRPVQNWDKAMGMSATAPRRHLRPLSRLLGSSVDELKDWGVGYLTSRQLNDMGTSCNSLGCWTFPMRDAQGKVVGLRLRNYDGFKYAVSGSRNGLFYHPQSLVKRASILIVDGASDSFVGWTKGLNIIGRPSSTTGNPEIMEMFQWLKPTEIHQILDADTNANREHARDAANELISQYSYGSIFYPSKGKDLREWLLETNSLPTKLSASAITCGRTARCSKQ